MTKQFIFPLRVYIEDTDMGGIVYHPNYLKFMERARTEWLASEGLDIDVLAENDLLFVVRQADIQYISPAFLNNQLNIVCRVSKLSRTMLFFEHEVRAQDDSTKIYCTMQCQLVCVNKQLKPVAIPNALKEAVT